MHALTIAHHVIFHAPILVHAITHMAHSLPGLHNMAGGPGYSPRH